MDSVSLSAAPVRRPVDVRWFVPAVGWAIALALALRFFSATTLLLLGFLGAGCIASLLLPVARRIPGPRVLGALLVGFLPWLVFGGLAALLGWRLSAVIRSQLASWPEVRDRANELLASVGHAVGMSQPPTMQDLLGRAGEALTGSQGAQVVATGASMVTGVMVLIAFLFFGPIFLLAEHEDRLLGPVVALLPEDRRPQVRDAVHDLVPRLRGWFLGTLVSMSIIGVASGVGYALVGLPLALPLALFAGLAQIVPTFGPLAAYLVAGVIAATQGAHLLLAVTGVYALIQLLETHVITPLVMRGAIRIPPIVTLFTIVFWGQVFGLPGVLLALPLDLTIWTLAQHMLKPKPVLEPG
jgi:predicted PurR-regulated permease PerM